MNTLESDLGRRENVSDPTSKEAVASGSILEAVGGAGALVLAIIGLSGVYPFYMLTVAAISLGAALVFEGGSIATRYSHLLKDMRADRASSIWSGMTAEFVGGTAGIVLGILGLLGVDPITLTSIAAIVFGAVALLSSGSAARLNKALIAESGAHPVAQSVARGAVTAGVDFQVVIGLAGVTLGVLALAGLNPMTLTLVAFLALGFGLLFSGATVAARMITLLG